MVIVIAPSPDAKRVYYCPEFTPGSVIRASRVQQVFSGKGVNAARAAARDGSEVICVVAVDHHHAEPDVLPLTEGIRWSPVIVEARTRSCVTILEPDGQATELVEEAGFLNKDEASRFRSACLEEMSKARVLVCAGSLPPGLSEDLYAELVIHARELGIMSIVDCHGTPLRKAVKAGPDLIKVTRTELRDTFGFAEDDGPESWVKVLSQRTRGWVIATAGTETVFGSGSDGSRIQWRPRRVPVRNPIGAGDAMTGVIASALCHGASIEEALARGMEAGSAQVSRGME